MKLLSVFLKTLLFLNFGCNKNEKRTDEIEIAINEIRKTDSAFCQLSVNKGFSYALIAYADSEVVKLNEGEFPIIGIENLKLKLSGNEKSESVIKWSPLKISVSNSCDLGYSFGNWEYKTFTKNGDTIYYGNYITIWKKQKDRTWKYVLDGGNNTPKPK